MTTKNTVMHTDKNIGSKTGTLFIVATPIGNLGDITQRAIETLKKVDKVCAEDTRNTRKLLTHFGIQADLHALHDHNEQNRIAQVKNWLDAGENIALVSDAGTPLISDPGYHLVQQLGNSDLEESYKIEPIPGASAIIAALSIAGLPTDRFTFEGFLPAKTVSKKKVLQANEKELRTQVYYESSHRIAVTIEAMLEIFGENRKVVLARELTKLYEQTFRGDLAELNVWINEDPMHQKGEFVLMLEGYQGSNEEATQVSNEKILMILLKELPVKQAASLAAKITGGKKNHFYKCAMELK